jgi:hypothetical protein
MSGESETKFNISRSRQAQIIEFASNKGFNYKRGSNRVEPQQRQLSDFTVSCKHCGASGSEWIILRGSRDNVRKGFVQIFYCKKCGRKFSRQGWGNYPLWVVWAILSFAMEGISFSEIVRKLEDEALRHEKTIKISRQTVRNIIERCVNAFLRFEQKEVNKAIFQSVEWQIDDTPQYPFWVTNVLDSDSRYWLTAYVSFVVRDSEVSKRAAKKAVKLAPHLPNQWRCDGWLAHKRGIKNLLPHATIFSRKKTEYYGHVNLIEGLIHSFMRGKGIKKGKKFRSLKTLQSLVDLVRIWHNFLRLMGSLAGVTPAAKLGIVPVFKNWGEFIEYVFQRV